MHGEAKEKENGGSELPSCCSKSAGCGNPSQKGTKHLWIVLAALVLLLFSARWIPILVPFRKAILDYGRMIALPMILGLVLGGMIDYYIPREYISKYLAQRKKRTIFYAAGFGFLMTACSHGILALSMELHKKGASGPAVVSFLLASPWANLPMTFLLIGFFGWKGFVIIASALVVALITGFSLQKLDEKGRIERNKNSVSVETGFSIRRDLKRRFSEYRFNLESVAKDFRGIAKGTTALTDMVLWWILIGIILAGLTSAYVPHDVFHRFFGPSFLGLLVTMAAATVFEVCSEGTSPLAFELYRNTGAFGNAFVFLMGGVVTDYTEIGLIWINIGRRTALWTMAVALPQVILLGWVFNRVF
ncbi:MAG TPA: permease [Candidatus Omnitrophota bacterium]|nr:permease [Candidatus Omnitrophota bacterium]